MAAAGAKAITVINLKGGVGKTHTAWLLTCVCAERGTRLLAIDCDTQANLSRSLLEDRDIAPGLEVLFHPAADTDPTKLIRPSRFPSVDILPARPSLARFDVADQATWEKSDLHLSFVDLVAELRGQYDYLVFDCPPRLSLVSFASLCASDYVVTARIPGFPIPAGSGGSADLSREAAGTLWYTGLRHGHSGSCPVRTVRHQWSPHTLYAPTSLEADIARQLFAELEQHIGRAGQPVSACRTEAL